MRYSNIEWPVGKTAGQFFSEDLVKIKKIRKTYKKVRIIQKRFSTYIYEIHESIQNIDDLEADILEIAIKYHTKSHGTEPFDSEINELDKKIRIKQEIIQQRINWLFGNKSNHISELNPISEEFIL